MTRQETKEWAASFKEFPNCNKCPFVKNEVDVGIGIIRDCDSVCSMEVEEIIREMGGGRNEINDNIGMPF